MISELDQANIVNDQIKQLDKKIKTAVDMQSFAIQHRDNEGMRIWKVEIKRLRLERHNLHESLHYVNFQTFAKVAKSFLTKDQYEAIWKKVDECIENPNLMQKAKKGELIV